MVPLPCLVGVWGTSDVVCVNWTVPDLIILNGFFYGLFRQPSYKLMNCYPFVCSFDFPSVKSLLFSIYSVEKGVVCSLVFIKGLVGCVKIIYTSPVLLEYYPCDIVKVQVDGWVQFCVNGDP